MGVKSISANFFEEYGIKPVAGRLFDSKIDKEDDPVPGVINAIAARQLGFASPEQAVGQNLPFWSKASSGPPLLTQTLRSTPPQSPLCSLPAGPSRPSDQ